MPAVESSSATMQLQLLSLEQPVQTYTINWLELQTTTGNYLIQPGHAPLLLILAPDSKVICSLAQTQEQKVLVVRQGLAHIERQRVTLNYNS